MQPRSAQVIWKQETHALMCAEVLNSFDCQTEKGHTPWQSQHFEEKDAFKF